MSDFDLRRPNALSFFRLFFASLVIISHSPELIDGNSNREVLKNIFGTLTSGQVAVYGFFFISGFLVLDSAMRSSIYAFMSRRVLRIVPGFVVAYLISISLVFWLGGGDFDELSPSQWAAKLSKMALLLNPAQVGSAFAGSHAPDVNGSLWTIAYEFRCYVLVAIVVFCLGRVTLVFSIMSMSLAIILVSSISQGVYFRYDLGNFEPIGNVDDAVRFTMIFSIGALFQLLKENVRRSNRVALLCCFLLIGGMCSERLAPLAVGVFGGYLVLYLAFLNENSVLNSINRRNDISYGVYLYAWPIQKLLIMYVPAITPTQLTILTLPIAVCAGFLSWHLVEKRAIHMRLPILRTA
ncbi:acyltransferase [Mesorhizobium sp.]|jgi:peptidoglycan/LPS O-acetylase OafA/YrhL|uniref:acyltransferase family protein n=1 Tax=Mesorhizobium TaxID=68287 RepID=UPI000FE6B9B1|nr:acyltransferase [Mesorhizobium sp.]RWO92535.1 MAG: acyltransferase [Mesorhizobium sp.]RWQ58577.1 MAG: acyltransferase [Mesorhizobium sp.]